MGSAFHLSDALAKNDKERDRANDWEKAVLKDLSVQFAGFVSLRADLFLNILNIRDFHREGTSQSERDRHFIYLTPWRRMTKIKAGLTTKKRFYRQGTSQSEWDRHFIYLTPWRRMTKSETGLMTGKRVCKKSPDTAFVISPLVLVCLEKK
ncbi:hypothetical protein CEXT_200601 [Caerostris extrusa]|uniref:Uncharacterized protein n=1 Tax=Caerostris extrusa TaxID=172846 RepID=A0AAV4MYQ3_CAEEX|nr:hypothetical protein CEXT_200601 [Caerostris extrusa]